MVQEDATLSHLQDWLVAIAAHTRETAEAVKAGRGGAAPAAPGAPGAASGAAGGGGLGLDKLTKSANVAQAALGTFVSSFDKAIASLGNGVTRFVALANPGAVKQFDMAVENAMSALGRVLAPALETATDLVQQIGNAIESLSPQAKQLISGMVIATGIAAALGAALAALGAIAAVAGGPVTLIIALGSALAGLALSGAAGKKAAAGFQEVLKALGTAFEAVASILEPIITSLIIPLFKRLADNIKMVAEFVANAVNRIRSALGFSRINYDPAKETAVAARQAQIGDLRGFASRAYTSAYNSQGGKSTVPERQLEVAREQVREAKRQTAAIGRMAQNLAAFGGAAARRYNRRAPAPGVSRDKMSSRLV